MKKFTAIFYYRSATGTLEEERITETVKSKAEFSRRAKETARIKEWRLVDIFEETV